MIEPIDMAAFMDAYQTPGRGGRGCPKVFICIISIFHPQTDRVCAGREAVTWPRSA